MQRVVFSGNSLYFSAMKRVALHTLGCKLNFSETSTLGRQFIDRHFEVVQAGEPVDVFVLNTCSVTGRADRECRQIIRRTLRGSPDAFIIVVGCYAQLQPEEIAAIDGVDLVLGATEKFRLFEHAGNFRKGSLPQVFVSCIDDATSFDPAFSAEVGGRTRAFLKIQDGCDYQCAFCTIPLARGTSRSHPADLVLEQARTIAAQGYREIVLTGVNVGDYGTKDGSSLFDLMKRLDHIDGLERIRVSSIEPNLLTRPMIDFVLSSDKFCNHFHIPLQSGSNTILKRMRRRYVREHYRDVVEYIRRIDPDAGIGVDVIVGFPGETDDLYEETYRFLADLAVSYLHVFTYSERERTTALDLEGVVEPKVRFTRNEMLRLLGARKRRLFQESFIGRRMTVLFEGKLHGDRSSGLTRNYLRVEASTDRPVVNELLDVDIQAVEGDACLGTIPSHHPHERNIRSELSTMYTAGQTEVSLPVEFR